MKIEKLLNLGLGDRLSWFGLTGCFVAFIRIDIPAIITIDVPDQHEAKVFLVSLAFVVIGGLLIIWRTMKEEATQDRRTEGREKEELTKGDKLFLEFISGLLPLTIAQIHDVKFPYDVKRTKPELIIASVYKRMGALVRYGVVVQDGDEFDLRDKPDQTILVEK